MEGSRLEEVPLPLLWRSRGQPRVQGTGRGGRGAEGLALRPEHSSARRWMRFPRQF